jgi:hypothetical protein
MEAHPAGIAHHGGCDLEELHADGGRAGLGQLGGAFQCT